MFSRWNFAWVCVFSYFLFCEQAPAADDDDDMDPFGEETEEKEKASEEKEGAKKDTKKPKGSKPLYFFYYKHMSYGEQMWWVHNDGFSFSS